ncbi:hypothetical protein MKEN_00241000 [Mycena kentingensis (nom. inval.)]|nr:hypothetical protein MKEN_00241000 [Mycena kentingensis (nom. inval.)]
MALPTYSTAGPSKPPMARYVVQSSDVLADLIINVKEESSDKVVWFKERFLEDEEIVEHLVHKESGRIRWTMHRPRTGWYIRIRSPSFPPGAYIPLIPPPQNSPHPPGSLLFSSRTNALPTRPIPPPLEPRASSSSHSYPPTPPAAPSVFVHPPTPSAIEAHMEQQASQSSQSTRHRPPAQQTITPFVLSPYQLDGGTKPEEMSFLQRAFSVIRKNSAVPSYSFTLARVPPDTTPVPSTPVPAPAQTPSLAASSPPTSPSQTALTVLPSPPLQPQRAQPPLLTFTDRTPTMTLHAVTGLLEVSAAEERMLGVESSFWIAVGLTYLEFLQEKESYLAALSD